MFPGVTTAAASPVTLSTGSVTFNTGGTLAENVNFSGNTSDLLQSTGTITIGSGASISLNIVNPLTQNSYILATANSPISGMFGTVTGAPTGYAVVYNKTGDDIELDRVQAVQSFSSSTVDLGRVVQGTTLTNAALGNLQNSGNLALNVGLSSSGVSTGLTISNLQPSSGTVAPSGSTAVTATVATSSAAVNALGPSYFTVTNTDNNANPQTSSVTASVTVINNRSFTLSDAPGLTNNDTTLALGRFLYGTANEFPYNTFVYTSSGSHATTADVTVLGVNGGTANNVAANGILAVPYNNSDLTFNGSNNNDNSAAISLYFDVDKYGNPSPIPVGTLSTTLTLNATGEAGVIGQTVTGPSITVTSDAVNLRTITDPATTNLGPLHAGAAVNFTTDNFTTSGTHDTTTDVTVAGTSSSGTINGLTVSAPYGATIFNGSTPNGQYGTIDSDNRVISGNITGSGAISGTFSLAVSGYNGDVGSDYNYNPVSLNFTATVYSGVGIWTSPTSGIWDLGTPGNWQAAGGVPGLDPNFTTTDSATFGDSSISPGTPITVSLVDNSPSINTLTFTGNGDYTIAQGTDNQDNPGTGMLHLNGGSSPAVISDTAGNNTISARSCSTLAPTSRSPAPNRSPSRDQSRPAAIATASPSRAAAACSFRVPAPMPAARRSVPARS